LLPTAAFSQNLFDPGGKAAARILVVDWCSPVRYSRALRIRKLSADARRGLRAAEQLAREHPRGCRRAVRAAGKDAGYGRRRQLPNTRRRGSSYCAFGARPLGRGWRVAAGRAAAAFEMRRFRPIIVSVVRGTSKRGRGGQVRHECGSRIQRRTVLVTMQETALLPAVSAGQRDVAVSRFRLRWRVWSVLH